MIGWSGPGVKMSEWRREGGAGEAGWGGGGAWLPLAERTPPSLGAGLTLRESGCSGWRVAKKEAQAPQAAEENGWVLEAASLPGVDPHPKPAGQRDQVPGWAAGQAGLEGCGSGGSDDAHRCSKWSVAGLSPGSALLVLFGQETGRTLADGGLRSCWVCLRQPPLKPLLPDLQLWLLRQLSVPKVLFSSRLDLNSASLRYFQGRLSW
jgi:hypothetical protein